MAESNEMSPKGWLVFLDSGTVFQPNDSEGVDAYLDNYRTFCKVEPVYSHERTPTIAEAMSVVIEALRSDSGYWQSWQANIAVAFQDEFANERPYEPIIDGLIIDKISNAAAARFLKNLTHKPATDGLQAIH